MNLYNHSLRPKNRSNIYIVGELNKLIENLEAGITDFKTTIVNQAAYFHLINPTDIRSDLVEMWYEIREFVGYQENSVISNAESMRSPIRSKVNDFTNEDIRMLMEKLHELKRQLLDEFKK